MIRLKIRENTDYESAVYNVISGNLIDEVIRIGYKTTYDSSVIDMEIRKEDVKDLYIFACWNEDDNRTLIFISVREDWDLIYVGAKSGKYFDNVDVITSAINAWIHNN